jgi:hypothetical protein
MSVVLFKRTRRMSGWSAIAVICSGLVGCSGGESPPQDMSVEVSPDQAFDDGVVASFDNIVSPSTADGRTVLSPPDIVKAQADFDRAADSLLQR